MREASRSTSMTRFSKTSVFTSVTYGDPSCAMGHLYPSTSTLHPSLTPGSPIFIKPSMILTRSNALPDNHNTPGLSGKILHAPTSELGGKIHNAPAITLGGKILYASAPSSSYLIPGRFRIQQSPDDEQSTHCLKR